MKIIENTGLDQNIYKSGYVIMALSDRGFPALPFDADYNIEYCKKCIQTDVNNSDFDKIYLTGWEKFKKRCGGWTQAKALAKINGINKVLGVSVFSKRATAEEAMREGEVAECGGQYMRWGYDNNKVLPSGLAKKLENADWGIFSVKYKPGEEVQITSQQPISTYYDKDYQNQIRDLAKKVADSPIGVDITDQVEKKLSAGKTEVYGPKKVGELQKFLAEQYQHQWIYWCFEDEQRKCQPYVSKEGTNILELNLDSPINECSVASLLKEMNKYATNKYLVVKANGKAYEIETVTISQSRIEFNLVDWGSVDESSKSSSKKYTRKQISEAIKYWQKQLEAGNYRK